LFIKSLFILKKINLKLSATNLPQEKNLESIFSKLPLNILYVCSKKEVFQEIQVSHILKDNIVDIVHINYPDIMITEVKNTSKKKYKKYLFIDSSFDYYDHIMQILKDNKDISFKFIFRNPYRFMNLSLVLLKIESNDKNLLKRISTLFSDNLQKDLIFDNKKLSNVFHPIVDSGNIIDVVESSSEINVPLKILDSNKGVLMGINRGNRIYISPKHFLSHSYLIGKTGSGKSVFMRNIIIQNIKKMNPCIVIDPHNIADIILSKLNKKDLKNVVLVDFSDLKYSINPLDLSSSKNPYLLIDNTVSIFKDLYSEFWGPQSDDILRRSLSALIFSEEDYSILDLEEFLTDDHFRLKVLFSVHDRDTLDYFDNIFSKWDNRSRSERISPILNKIGRLKSDKFISQFVSGNKDLLDLKTLVKEGKSVIFSVSKKFVGEENSKFLGSLVINQIRNVILQEDINRHIYLYIDEFQNFISDNFLFIFSESRKYNLSIFIANQYIDQIDQKYLSSIIENCSNFYVMDIGENSKKYLSQVLKFEIPSKISEHIIYAKNGNNPVYTIYSYVKKHG
jgi:hypothetical protein